MTTIFRTAICVAAIVGTAGPAHAAASAPPPVQLVQAGDGQKSCEVLASEINALASAEVAPRKKRGFGLGGLGKVLVMANPMTAMASGLGGGGMTSAIVGQVAGAAQQGAMQSATDARTDAAMDAMTGATSIEAQRKARLLGYFQAKGC